MMLEIKDLSLRFGGLDALKNISLNVESETITGVIGPNGAGKTSLFNVISGIYRPTAGDIRFGGQLINKIPFDRVNRLGVARTFQNLMTFPRLTALQNVLIGRQSRTHAGVFGSVLRLPGARRERRAARERALELLDYVGLADKSDALAGELAYGQQRQLDIARALATDPKLILLDEPAAGLNSHERLGLRRLIQKLQDEHYTVMFIEHDINFVMSLSTQVAVLNFGEMITHGTPQAVQSDQRVIEAYLGESQ